MSAEKNVFTVTPWKLCGELSWEAYREGYRKAADTLALNLVNSGGNYISDLHMRFGMIYPIMFLYRHYIEIEFKQLLALIGMTTLVDTKKKYGHDLRALWSKVLECVEAVQGKDARQEFAGAFERTIAYFERVDPQRDGFRYPKNSKGHGQWDSPLEVDVATIHSSVNQLEQCCAELRREFKQVLDTEAEDMSDRYYFY
jgi:hypothetical protein